MAPSVRSVGSAAAGTTTVSPGLPAGFAADDILVLVIESYTDGGFAGFPSGFAHAPDSFVSGTDTWLTVAWKRATGGESNLTITGVEDHVAAQCIAISGAVASGNPWDVTASDTGSGFPVAVPGDSTTVNDCLIVAAVSTGVDADSTTMVSSWANSDLTNVTERMDYWSTQGNGGGFGVATGEKAAAGAFGDTTATLFTQAAQALWVGALKPAVAGAEPLAAQPSVAARITAALRATVPLTSSPAAAVSMRAEMTETGPGVEALTARPSSASSITAALTETPSGQPEALAAAVPTAGSLGPAALTAAVTLAGSVRGAASIDAETSVEGPTYGDGVAGSGTYGNLTFSSPTPALVPAARPGASSPFARLPLPPYIPLVTVTGVGTYGVGTAGSGTYGNPNLGVADQFRAGGVDYAEA